MSLMLVAAATVVLGRDPMGTVHPVFDFHESGLDWRSIDDVVMGGRSASRMDVGDGVATFRGRVSLENNGGFASVRSAPGQHDLSRFDGLALRVRGDGKRYGLRLRTERGFDGVNYQAPLATRPGEWIEVRLPFGAFLPVFRGRRVPDHPALDPARIRTFGFIISEKQAGEFRLDVEWIKAYADPQDGRRD